MGKKGRLVAGGIQGEVENKREGEKGGERIGFEGESETEWHLHWLPAKSHLIKMSERRLGTSQGNTV